MEGLNNQIRNKITAANVMNDKAMLEPLKINGSVNIKGYANGPSKEKPKTVSISEIDIPISPGGVGKSNTAKVVTIIAGQNNDNNKSIILTLVFITFYIVNTGVRFLPVQAQ